MTVFGMGCPSQNRREVSIFFPFFATLFTDQKEKELSQINIHWHVSEILKKKNCLATIISCTNTALFSGVTSEKRIERKPRLFNFQRA